MKQIRNPNINQIVMNKYDLFMDVIDNLGRYHKYMAYPKHCGVINYFDTLAESRKWEKDVVQMYKLENDISTHDYEVLMVKTGNSFFL